MEIYHQPVVFDCGGSQLIGIIEHPENPRASGILIVTGGPQYRIGSHRQFVSIARKLAQSGLPTMRFDYRGMGDSGGEQIGFDECSQDLRAAIDIFVANTGVQRVALWALCDAASACMIYCSQDNRVAAMILLNPWVRSDAGRAQAFVKHYYLKRFFSSGFWRKLLGRRFRTREAIRDLIKNVRLAAFGRAEVSIRPQTGENKAPLTDFRDRMYSGFKAFDGEVLFLLCDADLTAAEFSDFTKQSKLWRRLMKKKSVTQLHMANMDHTFSKKIWREQIVDNTIAWIGAREF